MIGIAKKVEEAVISVLKSQTGMESVEVVRGNAAATHAAFPRVVVTCLVGKAVYPGMDKPLSAELELLFQSEARVDVTGESCESLVEIAYTALKNPVGVPAVNTVSNDFTLYKLEFQSPDEVEEHQGMMELELIAELFVG